MTRKTLLQGTVLCALMFLFFSCEKENAKETSPELSDTSLKSGSATYSLLNCEDDTVGTVTITQNFGVISVVYETIGGWELLSTNVHAEYDWNDIPQTQFGEPIIEEFDYTNIHDPTVQYFGITLDEDFYGRFYIACHATVHNTTDCPVNAWALGTHFPGSACAMYRYFYPYNGKNPQVGGR